LTIKLGVKTKESDFNKVQRALSSFLIEGEEIQFLGQSINLRPMFGFLVITNERVIAANVPDKDPIKKEIPHSSVKAAGLGTGTFDKNNLIIEKTDGSKHSFGTIKADDNSNIIEILKELHGKQNNPEFQTLRDEMIKPAIRKQSEIPIIGKKPNSKSMKVILDHCHEDEVPRFILSTGMGTGVFVAFDDRCMIIKSGAVTSFMAGSLFGGRVSTFHYGEITGIEYNSGLLTGVLEVLTASYEGSKNKDYWRGTFKSRNADSNDPWTLSNCLPLDRATYNLAQNQLNDLRKQISKAKNPTVVVSPSVQPNHSIADQLRDLNELFQSGALTDDEFAEAKARIISGN